VQVLDQHRHWTGCRQGGQELRPAPRELAHDGERSTAVQWVIRQRDAGRRSQSKDRARDVRCREAGGREQLARSRLQLGLRLVRALVERDGAGGAHDLGKRPVGDSLSDGRAPSAEDLEFSSLRRGPRHELANQAALPDSGIPVDHREARQTPLNDLVEQRLQDGELTIPAHHPRLQVARRPSFDGACDWPDERVCGDRLLLSLQAQLGSRTEGERGRCGPLRAFADEHGPRVGRGLKACRDVDGIACHHRPVGADLGRGDHFAGVDADSQRELDSVAAMDVRRDLANAAHDLAGGAQRPRCIVLADAWHAEDADRGIADELLQGPAPGLDRG
jgi:hypothetical protein